VTETLSCNFADKSAVEVFYGNAQKKEMAVLVVNSLLKSSKI